jgi:hypothetical protein
LKGAPAGLDREASTYATIPLEPLFQRAPRTPRADQEVEAAQISVDATAPFVGALLSTPILGESLRAADGAAGIMMGIGVLLLLRGADLR